MDSDEEPSEQAVRQTVKRKLSSQAESNTIKRPPPPDGSPPTYKDKEEDDEEKTRRVRRKEKKGPKKTEREKRKAFLKKRIECLQREMDKCDAGNFSDSSYSSSEEEAIEKEINQRTKKYKNLDAIPLPKVSDNKDHGNNDNKEDISDRKPKSSDDGDNDNDEEVEPTSSRVPSCSKLPESRPIDDSSDISDGEIARMIERYNNRSPKIPGSQPDDDSIDLSDGEIARMLERIERDSPKLLESSDDEETRGPPKKLRKNDGTTMETWKEENVPDGKPRSWIDDDNDSDEDDSLESLRTLINNILAKDWTARKRSSCSSIPTPKHSIFAPRSAGSDKNEDPNSNSQNKKKLADEDVMAFQEELARIKEKYNAIPPSEPSDNDREFSHKINGIFNSLAAITGNSEPRWTERDTEEDSIANSSDEEGKTHGKEFLKEVWAAAVTTVDRISEKLEEPTSEASSPSRSSVTTPILPDSDPRSPERDKVDDSIPISQKEESTTNASESNPGEALPEDKTQNKEPESPIDAALSDIDGDHNEVTATQEPNSSDPGNVSGLSVTLPVTALERNKKEESTNNATESKSGEDLPEGKVHIKESKSPIGAALLDTYSDDDDEVTAPQEPNSSDH